MSHFKKNVFIINTPQGTEFEISASETGRHNEDGTVDFNENGQVNYTFESIEDFTDHYFLNSSVVYLHSLYVGDRDDEGNITWFDEEYSLSELDENEDGSCVYTAPKLHTCLDADFLEKINNCDAFDLLELILSRPELVANRLTLTLFRRKNNALKVGDLF